MNAKVDLKQFRAEIESRRAYCVRKITNNQKAIKKLTNQVTSIDDILQGSALEERVGAVLDAAVTIGFKNVHQCDFSRRWDLKCKLENPKLSRELSVELTITDSGNIVFLGYEGYDSEYSYEHKYRTAHVIRISYFKSLKVTDNIMAYLVHRKKRK